MPSPVRPEQPLRRRVGLALALATAGALSACIMVPVGRTYGGRQPDYDDEGEVVGVAPPPPQVDVVIAAPGPGYFWISGFWGWIGGRHVWIGGHWAPHRPGWRWAPFGWYPYARGWRARPGRWERG